MSLQVSYLHLSGALVQKMLESKKEAERGKQGPARKTEIVSAILLHVFILFIPRSLGFLFFFNHCNHWNIFSTVTTNVYVTGSFSLHLHLLSSSLALISSSFMILSLCQSTLHRVWSFTFSTFQQAIHFLLSSFWQERSLVSDAQRRKQREAVQKEVDKLRASIQSLTRSANPLGKVGNSHPYH